MTPDLNSIIASLSEKEGSGASASGPGSREPSPTVSALSGFDQAQAGRPQSQGLCETTLTERFDLPCFCATYEGNLGPCAQFSRGQNHRCAYCDHALVCHAEGR